MQYMAVEAGTAEELNEKVNEKIKEGWKPLGGVAISLSESDEYQYFVIAQAMTTNNMSLKAT